MKYSKLVRSIYLDYSDQVESFGMDECWIDISSKDMNIEKGTTIAHEIRERVKFETGLTISVGVSFNKIFAWFDFILHIMRDIVRLHATK